MGEQETSIHPERELSYPIGVDHFVSVRITIVCTHIWVIHFSLVWICCGDWLHDIFMFCPFKSYNSKFSMFTLISRHKFAPKKTGISLRQGPADSKCFSFWPIWSCLQLLTSALCNEWVWLFADLKPPHSLQPPVQPVAFHKWWMFALITHLSYG